MSFRIKKAKANARKSKKKKDSLCKIHKPCRSNFPFQIVNTLHKLGSFRGVQEPNLTRPCSPAKTLTDQSFDAQPLSFRELCP